MSPATAEARRIGVPHSAVSGTSYLVMREDEFQLSLDALVPPRPAPKPAAPAPAAPVARATAAGGTLDDVLTGAWRTLGAQRGAACPVCGDQMLPQPGARGGHCGGCGSTLA